MNIVNRLDQLETFSLDCQKAVTEQTVPTADEVMTMREAFSDLCTATVQDLASEPRIANNRAAFEAMQNAIEALRRRMMAHQLKWNVDRIRQDPAGYFAAVQPLNDVLRDFVTNARVLVRD